MTAVDRLPDVSDCAPLPADSESFPPINFVYQHLHNALRGELQRLAELVHSIEARVEAQDVSEDLQTLHDRYHLLVQVNRYHSSVEDEVVYPALEHKVKNVTRSYSVEHGEEDHLFDSLQDLLATVIRAEGGDRAVLMREFVCKVDEVSVTLRKHLRKEEEQLFPLVLSHFSFDEQAELVVQFVCCIPVLSVLNVLSWLCAGVSRAERHSLIANVRKLRIDPHLSRLTCLWLEACAGHTPLLAASRCPAAAPEDAGAAAAAAAGAPAQGGGLADPLDVLVHLHRGLLHTLARLAAEVEELRAAGGRPCGHALARLTRHWQFLCALTAFHRLSEDLFVFPAARSVSDGAEGACGHCEDEHRSEAQSLTALGRLLSDLSSSARRGAADAPDVLRQLSAATADAVAAARAHTAREEAELLPELRARLSPPAKHALVRQTLQALPLRLLERVVPWVAQQVGPEGLAALVQPQRPGAGAPADAVLVQLVAKWAQRAFAADAAAAGAAAADMETAFPVVTCAPQVVTLADRWASLELAADAARKASPPPAALAHEPSNDSDATAAAALDCVAAGGKRPRSPSPPPLAAAAPAAANPIDHIFQFHKALRRELRAVEQEVRALQAAAARTAATPRPPDDGFDFAGALRLFDGRLCFLEGIYKAHSESEDEVVFPALEAKKALQNVSTSYTMDHAEEAKLFAGLRAVIDELNACETQHAATAADEAARLQRRAALVSRLRQKCASARAALETHVRAEEADIWPLFSEHFTVEEQSALVGNVIGRTGADVLQALIPWVMGSVSAAEKGAMVVALRQATANTHFDKWMAKAVPTDVENGRAAAAACATCSDAAARPEAKAVADMTAYQPGWADIFRMNATQLEAAAAAADAGGGGGEGEGEDALRRRYLTHNLLVTRFLVAQQQRMGEAPDATTASSPPDGAAATPAAAPPRRRGCAHYAANCTLVAPCCGAEVPCRLCHDDGVACAKPFDRYAVREMRCLLCDTRQPVAKHCNACKARMARYYCGVCHLFEDDPGKAIYHCPFCNMCRRGRGLGSDSFHCMTCNACMSLELYNRHTCRERAMESNCPICHEDLFASATPVKELPCGHFMHSSCFAEYTLQRYTCPICCRSVGDLTLYFRMLDRLLLTETMPEELAGKVQRVHCNDCGGKSSVPYHFVYHKCRACSSYNTRLV